jgi:hypothetical protein
VAQSFRFGFTGSLPLLAAAKDAAEKALFTLFSFLCVFLFLVDDSSLLNDFTSPSLEIIELHCEQDLRPQGLLRLILE